MLRACSNRSFTLSLSLASISLSTVTSVDTHALGFITGFPRGYIAIRAASPMGRMDRPGFYNSHHGRWCCHLRNAQDASKQKSSQEEDSPKFGDEWGELLRPPGFSPRRIAPSPEWDAYGQWCPWR